MNLSALIAEYGYWAIFVGCFLEGQTVLLLAGFATHRGILRFEQVVLIGALRVAPVRFTWLNAIGAAIWALLVTSLGYQFGNALQWVFVDLRRIEEAVLVLILLAGLGHGLWKFWRWRTDRD